MRAVFVAGIGNSASDHWQYEWYSRWPDSVWVEHENWADPEYGKWVKDLTAALATITGPKLLIAHSLGCLLAARWAVEHYDPTVVGGFFVAVPDPLSANFPNQAQGFSPVPMQPLPMRSIVIASEDDPYGSLSYARALSGAWRAGFVNYGRRGHLNAKSGLGEWDDGQRLLAAHFPFNSVPGTAPKQQRVE